MRDPESREIAENQITLDPGSRPAPRGLGRDDKLRSALPVEGRTWKNNHIELKRTILKVEEQSFPENDEVSFRLYPKKLPDLERHGSACVSCGAPGPERIATTKHHDFLN